VLELHDQQDNGAIIATHENWDGSLFAHFMYLGTSVWASGSKDPAIAIMLNPGAYPAIVGGKNEPAASL
jgi:hypothetical protein